MMKMNDFGFGTLLENPKGFTLATVIDGKALILASDGHKIVTVAEAEEGEDNIIVQAKCNPIDKFNVYTGIALALDRYGKKVHEREILTKYKRFAEAGYVAVKKVSTSELELGKDYAFVHPVALVDIK